MKPLKTPDPDEFYPIFFSKKNAILLGKIYVSLLQWFRDGDMPGDIGQRLIYLSPKQPNIETVKQLQPISLCNTIYKLVTNILVNRLNLSFLIGSLMIKMASSKKWGWILTWWWPRRFLMSCKKKE